MFDIVYTIHYRHTDKYIVSSQTFETHEEAKDFVEQKATEIKKLDNLYAITYNEDELCLEAKTDNATYSIECFKPAFY